MVASFKSEPEFYAAECKLLRDSYLPLLICCGECLEWSEGSDLLSGDRERLRRDRSWDRLEWSDASE